MELKEIISRKAEIIEVKKKARKFTQSEVFVLPAKLTQTDKAQKEDTEDVIYRTIVANTYNWMDSHDDVHINGLFKKSIRENKSTIVHLHDHIYTLAAKVGKPLNIYEQEIEWVKLGVNKAGTTMALLADTEIRKDYNEKIFAQYKSGEIQQHSVGMGYVNIELAANMPNEETEYKLWNKYINQLGNPEKATKKGYFWAVTEAKLYEFSAVIAGSNELTPTLENKTLLQEIEQKFGNVKDLQELCDLIALEKNQPPIGTESKQAAKSFFTNLI